MQLAYADSGYQGPRVAAASSNRLQIVRKIERQVGFVVHARRWRRRALLRLDQPKSPPGKGLRGHTRERGGIPLRRLQCPSATKARTLRKQFEMDSQVPSICKFITTNDLATVAE